jgi:hypothetical protein
MAFPPSRGLADEFDENFVATIVVRLVGPGHRPTTDYRLT